MSKETLKTKEVKKSKYSDVKNAEPKIEILDEELPITRQMIKIDKMDMPLTTVDEAKTMWQQYQDLISALIKENDVVVIQGKKRIKKSGVNKIARFFGYSTEIIRQKRVDFVGPQGGRNFVWYVWVRAIAPNGRSRTEGAACASNERRFAHLEHDTLATAITRASNRAIQELAGMGELELDEGDETEPKEPEEATDKQIEYIGKALQAIGKPGDEVAEIKLIINGEEKTIMDLNRNEADKIIKTIKEKGATIVFEELIKREE